MTTAGAIDRILDLARWAPSGDNTQPWRFEVVHSNHLVVHGHDTRDHCVYDLDGHPSQMSLGALLETVSIAASSFQLRAVVRRRPEMPPNRPTFDVELQPDADLMPSPLVASIPERSVQRSSFDTRPLRAEDKAALTHSLAPGYRLRWFEGAAAKARMAALLFRNAGLRLRMPEAYTVHRDIIDWGCRFSADRVPDQALGADAMTLRLMRWVMHDWARVRFFNRYLAGTWLPRIQMDLLPAWRCAAHVVILRESAPQSVDDHVEAGRMVQRLWLTATRLRLQQQPELTPLIFSRYVREGTGFTQDGHCQQLARSLEAQARTVIGDDLPHAVWIGRLGHAPSATSRSLRLNREALLSKCDD